MKNKTTVPSLKRVYLLLMFVDTKNRADCEFWVSIIYRRVVQNRFTAYTGWFFYPRSIIVMMINLLPCRYPSGINSKLLLYLIYGASNISIMHIKMCRERFRIYVKNGELSFGGLVVHEHVDSSPTEYTGLLFPLPWSSDYVRRFF